MVALMPPRELIKIGFCYTREAKKQYSLTKKKGSFFSNLVMEVKAFHLEKASFFQKEIRLSGHFVS